jgi:hypothetical protein
VARKARRPGGSLGRIEASPREEGLVLVQRREPADGVVEPVGLKAQLLRDATDGGRERRLVESLSDNGIHVIGAAPPSELQHQRPTAVDRQFHEQAPRGQVRAEEFEGLEETGAIEGRGHAASVAVPRPRRKGYSAAAANTVPARGRSSVSQVSTSAAVSAPMRSSSWKGEGVMRSRSVPRGTVG